MLKGLIKLTLFFIVLVSLVAGVLYYNEELRVTVLQYLFTEKPFVIQRPTERQPLVHKFDPAKNRQWLLVERPKDDIKKELFKFQVGPRPQIKSGQILVLNNYFSFDPTQRGWIGYRVTYRDPVELNSPMEAVGISTVVESKHPDYRVGDIIFALIAWEDFTVITPSIKRVFPTLKVLKGVSHWYYLTFGTDLTAIGSLVNIGKIKNTDHVLVTGAAGATGSIAGQVSKLMGASLVVGVAGGKEKAALLKSRYKFDQVIDYKSENITKRVKEIFGDHGVDVYFDNVGGEILDIVLDNLAHKGRIIICGSISQYNKGSNTYGLKNHMKLIVKEGLMQGFLVMSYLNDPTSILSYIWYQAIGITHTVDLRSNFDNIPDTFLGLFHGTNVGKLVLKNDT